MDAFLNGFAVVAQPDTLLYCLIGVVIGMLIGVLPGLGPAATMAILLPIVIPPIVIGALWRLMLGREFGIINAILTPLGIGPIDFLGDGRFALASVILVDVTRVSDSCGYGVPLLYEPLNRYETNLITTVEDGVAEAKRILSSSAPLDPGPRTR